MARSSEHSHQELLRVAVRLVLKDDGFSLPSSPAVRALKTAEALLEWISEAENKLAWATFADELIRCLEECFPSHRSLKVRRERMWERYYKLRSSTPFKDRWIELLRSSGTSSGEPSPIFYQFVTDAIFEELIKRKFPVEESQREQEVSLDYEEQNALRYTAGAVIRSLTKKIGRSAHSLKKELLLCLADLTEDATESEDDSGHWICAIDRGGLKHVSNPAYMMFTAMELALRRHLSSRRASELAELKAATQLVTEDDDVLFCWSMLSVNWEQEAQVLLLMLVEHWVTLSGFSFASAFIEQFKQSAKKSVQKAKGVRKQLQGKSSAAKSTD